MTISTLKTQFNITTYPGTESEQQLECSVFQDDVEQGCRTKGHDYDANPEWIFEINVVKGSGCGQKSYGHKSPLDAQAAMMLRALAYGNGGFPLEHSHGRYNQGHGVW
jgi:hypothetical protein